MTIRNDIDYEEMSFRQLRIGEAFKADNKIYMKVARDSEEFNAYDFSNDKLVCMDGNVPVRYIPSELVLHDKSWDYIE